MVAIRVSLLAGFYSLAAVLLIGASPALAKQVDCLLEINGKSYIDGMCEMRSLSGSGLPAGSFQLTRQSGERIFYFAQVFVDSPGKATGYWNGDLGSTHAHDSLGDLTASGACWVNERVRVCAWKLGETRTIPPSAQSKASQSEPPQEEMSSDTDVVPRYAVDQICAKHFPEGSPARGYCVKQEQDRYDLLKMMWDQVPKADRERCAMTAERSTMWNYGYLFSCVNAALQRQEVERLRRPQPFRY